MAFFLYGNLCWKIATSYVSYSYQLNLFAPPNKIFGIQEEAIENIKQEETKVYMSKLPDLFVLIEKLLVLRKISQDILYCVLTQFILSPIHKAQSADVFVQMAKLICLTKCFCPNCQMYLSNVKCCNTISFVSHSHSQTKIFMLSTVPSHDQ